MPIPQVRVISKQVIARPVQASGLTGLLLIQAERGPSEPTLISNMTEFMAKYTWTGQVPESASNRSAYYSAQNFLRDSDRLWVRRVIPTGAMYSIATFVEETDAALCAVDLDTATLNSNVLTVNSNVPSGTGERVTVYGLDIPSYTTIGGLINGGQYFLRKTVNGGNQDISFYSTEDYAIAGGATGRVLISSKGTGSLYLIPSEMPEADGLDDPSGVVVTSPQAFWLYATDQGDWGDNIRITIDVPRVDEASIRCADVVNDELGLLPADSTWLNGSVGLPIHLVPVGTGVLPEPNGEDVLDPLTAYFTVSAGDGSKFKLAETLANSLLVTPTTYTFDGDGNHGSGQMVAALIGSIGVVEAGAVIPGTNGVLPIVFAAGADMDIPCVASPVPCLLAGTVPSPFSKGTVYYAFRKAGADANQVCLATSVANAQAQNGITIPVITPSQNVEFSVLFFPVAQTIDRTTIVDATPLSTTPFNCTTDVDDVTNETIEIATTLTATDVPVGTKVWFEVVSGALPSPLVANTAYYVNNVANGTGSIIIKLTTTVGGGGSPIDLTAAVGTADMYAKATTQVLNQTSGHIISDQSIATGTPITLNEVTTGGLPLTVPGETLVDGTTFYAINQDTASSFLVALASSIENARDGIPIDLYANNGGVAGSFEISPINIEDNWNPNYNVIDLRGAVTFGGTGSGDKPATIQLPLHAGSYQGWVPGEPVRIFPTGSGSVLPYGLSSSATYFVLPVGEGLIQLCTRSGSVLESAAQLTPIKLSTDSDKKGAGYFTITSANEPLSAGTFRLKVWKRSEVTSSVVGQISYLVTLEESYVCSLYSNLQDSAGRNMELTRRLNSSKYIRGVGEDVTTNPNVKVKAVPMLTALDGGYAGANEGLISSSELVSALAEFTDPNQYDLTYLMDGGYTFADYQIGLISLAEGREDCTAVLSTPSELEDDANPARAIIEYVQTNLPSTSFGAVFTPWQLMTENGVDILVPPDGFVAAQMSRVDSTKGRWYAAAGLENGPIRSRGGSVNFSQANLDDLYANRVNPIIRIPDAGPTIWGNITLLAVQSPLSRINVRKLMNMIQSDLRKSLLQYVMVPINTETYVSITNMVNSYLGPILTKGGLEAYLTVCDSSNNTAEDRDAQRINVWVYVKPTQVSEFIDLTTVVTPSSVEFTTTGAA